MRPRKVVLCVGSDEEQLSARLFLFRTRGKYTPLAASTTEEALGILRTSGEVGLMIVQLPLLDLDAEMLHEAKLLQPCLRTLLISNLPIGDRCEYYDLLGADMVLRKGCDSPAELLERAFCLVARKRGPRKKLSESAIQLVSEPAIRRVA